jgi:hypothetical protein
VNELSRLHSVVMTRVVAENLPDSSRRV